MLNNLDINNLRFQKHVQNKFKQCRQRFDTFEFENCGNGEWKPITNNLYPLHGSRIQALAHLNNIENMMRFASYITLYSYV